MNSLTRDEEFMSLAIAEATTGKTLGNLPFGAVVVLNGEVVSFAHAEDASTSDVTAHAELQAIKKACQALKTINLKECIIYATNEPCVMCSGAILQAGINKIVIGAMRGDIPGRFMPKKYSINDFAENYGSKPEIIKGVLKDKVIELFKDSVK